MKHFAGVMIWLMIAHTCPNNLLEGSMDLPRVVGHLLKTLRMLLPLDLKSKLLIALNMSWQDKNGLLLHRYVAMFL